MIDRNKVIKLQGKIKEALKAIEKEEGVSITFGTRSFTGLEYGTRMVVKTTEKTANVRVAKTKSDVQMSKRYGFSDNIIGMTYNGGIITQFKPRNTKYPIIFEKYGKSYKTTTFSVKRELTEAKIAEFNNPTFDDIDIMGMGM